MCGHHLQTYFKVAPGVCIVLNAHIYRVVFRIVLDKFAFHKLM